MDYKKGDKVKHPKQDVWGLGVVLENQHDDKVRIFFENAGEKIISTKFILPTKLSDEEAKHPVLDGVKANSKLLGPTILLNNFLLKFPNGFQDVSFVEKEVVEKKEVSTFAQELLNQTMYMQLIEQAAYKDIVGIVKEIVDKDHFSLIDRFEKNALLQSLDKGGFQVAFADGLYDLLYGNPENFEQNFNDFSEVLMEMQVAKWTILTYFLFVFFPKKHILLKPSVTQSIANICEYNLQYESVLNFVTYQRSLKFAHYLAKNLKDLGSEPEDMVDIQSFMSVVEKYHA